MNRVVLLFPGGGTQYVGMGKALFDEHALVKDIFEEASDILGYNLKRICFDGDLDRLSRMNISQPAIFTVSMAAYKVLRQTTGIEPAFACGHSLGEFAALTAAGAMNFSQALELVKKRGELLHEAGQRDNAVMMAVNKAGSEQVEEECRKINNAGGKTYVAVYNSSLQHVISGNRDDVKKLAEQISRQGAETVMLNIVTPSHCPMLTAAVEAFSDAWKNFIPGPLEFPVISNVTALPYDEQFPDLPCMLLKQMTSPVRWLDTIHFIMNKGITHAVEMAPQTVLKQLMPYITDSINVYSLDIAEDLAAMNITFPAFKPTNN